MRNSCSASTDTDDSPKWPERYVVTVAPSSTASFGNSVLPLMFDVHVLLLTPGVTLYAKFSASRAPEKVRGSSSNCLLSRLVPTSGESVCNLGKALVTETVSMTDPTSRETSMRSTCVTPSSTASRTDRLKLGDSKSSL